MPGAIRSIGKYVSVTIWPAFVDRITQSVDHAADHRVADRHLMMRPVRFTFVAFFDLLKIAKEHRADFVFFEVEGEAANVVRKLEQLAGHDFFQTVDLGDTVADLDDGADFRHGHAGLEILDL